MKFSSSIQNKRFTNSSINSRCYRESYLFKNKVKINKIKIYIEREIFIYL